MKQILVAEDEGRTRRSIATVLESAGFSVQEAGNGKEAMDILLNSNNRIDLLLTDIVMPEMTGIELIYKIRKNFRILPIVVITAYRDKDLSDNLSRLRCSRIIDKPFEPDMLLESIEEAFIACEQ